METLTKERKADLLKEIIKRGCSVDHEEMTGVPTIICKLQDRIFEGLSSEDSKKFSEKFWRAVPVETDLSGVWDRFALWMLVDKKEGVLQYAKSSGVKKTPGSVTNDPSGHKSLKQPTENSIGNARSSSP